MFLLSCLSWKCSLLSMILIFSLTVKVRREPVVKKAKKQKQKNKKQKTKPESMLIHRVLLEYFVTSKGFTELQEMEKELGYCKLFISKMKDHQNKKRKAQTEHQQQQQNSKSKKVKTK
jgi:hypothetical protein